MTWFGSIFLLEYDVFDRYEAAKLRKTKVLDTIRALELPNNPLDDIIDQVKSSLSRWFHQFSHHQSSENSDLIGTYGEHSTGVECYLIGQLFIAYEFDSLFFSVCTVGRSRPGCRNDWAERDAGAGSEWKRGCLSSTEHVSNFIAVYLYSVIICSNGSRDDYHGLIKCSS